MGYSSWGCKELDTTERLTFICQALFRTCFLILRIWVTLYLVEKG